MTRADTRPAQLVATDVRVAYKVGRARLMAVDGVSLTIPERGRLGIIGESGSGKSSLAKAIAGLVPLAGGEITFADGTKVGSSSKAVPGAGDTAMMFQDPVLALNPRLPLWRSVAEAIEPRRWRPSSAARRVATELLGRVGLGADMAARRPSQLSGGQRQRVTLARALAGRARLLLCDEPVAALDVSLQAGLLRLIADVTAKEGVAYLVISHDLMSVGAACDELLVMYLGQIVERGPAREVLRRPLHPYTKALISAIPKLGTRTESTPVDIIGDVVDALSVPTGCRFRTRCPFARAECEHDVRLEVVDEDREVACRFWRQLSESA